MATRQSDIDRAWSLRLNQQIESCRALTLSLKKRLRLPDDRLTAEALLSSARAFPLSELAEVGLLLASLARAEGRWDFSHRLVDAVESGITEGGAAPSFQLYFQKGINLMVAGKHSSALECFLTAKRCPADPAVRAFASINLLFCLESLGLPVVKTRRELTRLLRGVREKGKINDVLNQLRAFDLRHAFRQGDFNSVCRPRRSSAETDQSTYYRLWVAELPYHSLHAQSAPAAREAFNLSNPFFHQKAYRVRTLYGICDAADTEQFKATELSDRLYLWTWRWLADPDGFPLDRVLSLLKPGLFSRLADRLTAEDFQLIRNALGWLALLDPAGLPAVQRLLQSIRVPQAEDFPLLGFESQMIQTLQHWRESHGRRLTIPPALRRSPLWDAPHLRWPLLLRGLAAQESPQPGLGPLQRLHDELHRLVFRTPRRLAGSRKALVVDLSTQQIRWRQRAPQVSPALCLAFDLLYHRGSVDQAEFLQICFGLPVYDPTIHAAKIFNLLARMRQAAPSGLTFQVRAGRVHARGSWKEVAVQRGMHHQLALSESADWKALIQRRSEGAAPRPERWAKPALALQRLSGRADLRREELEALTGKSRSTAHRMIQRWVREGIVQKTGKASQTRYTFNPR